MLTGCPQSSERCPACLGTRVRFAPDSATYRAIRKKHMVRYLAEFEWRFNHRFDLAGMIPALARTATQCKPVTYGQLKWADYGA